MISSVNAQKIETTIMSLPYLILITERHPPSRSLLPVSLETAWFIPSLNAPISTSN